MNDFDALLAELTPLAKAMSDASKGDGKGAPDTGDGKVAEAAAEGGTEPALLKTDDAAGEDDGDDGDMMGKSFQVTMPDGTVQEVFDGSAVMKALSAEIVGLKASNVEVTNKLATATGELAKSLAASTALLGMFKSLQGDVTRIGATGGGRRATLTIVDRPGPIAPEAPKVPDNAGLMAKAMTVFESRSGAITGSDIARAESHMGRGLPFPADIAARLPA